MKTALILSVVLFSNLAPAFIPPVAIMLKEVTEGRKNVPVELVLKHRIAVRGSGNVEFEERIFDEKKRTLFLWTGGPFAQPVAGLIEGATYQVQGQAIPTRSLAVVRYLTATTPDELRETLVAERLMRRDHLLQYKPGFSPEGDPQTWAIKENYMIHPDIYLRRLETGVAYAVAGSDEGSERRAVLFDRGLKGIRRMEWADAESSQSWSFEGFSPFSAGGNYPRRLAFESNGTEVIQSDVLAVRALNAKSVAEFKNTWRQSEKASLSSNGEGILRLLMSYR